MLLTAHQAWVSTNNLWLDDYPSKAGKYGGICIGTCKFQLIAWSYQRMPPLLIQPLALKLILIGCEMAVVCFMCSTDTKVTVSSLSGFSREAEGGVRLQPLLVVLAAAWRWYAPSYVVPADSSYSWLVRRMLTMYAMSSGMCCEHLLDITLT